jgi:hypothetical protein
MAIKVCHMFTKLPADAHAVNVCTNSQSWARALSPFVAGPVWLYGDEYAKNVENAWQFSKVYAKHTDDNGDPTPEYFAWARQGWADGYAHRFPMGKGAVPEYCWWDGAKLGYIDSRKRIYGPLYLEAVWTTSAIARLFALADEHDVWLRDWDGRVTDETFTEVLNNPSKKAGHAFFLKALYDQDPGLAELDWPRLV